MHFQQTPTGWAKIEDGLPTLLPKVHLCISVSADNVATLYHAGDPALCQNFARVLQKADEAANLSNSYEILDATFASEDELNRLVASRSEDPDAYRRLDPKHKTIFLLPEGIAYLEKHAGVTLKNPVNPLTVLDALQTSATGNATIPESFEANYMARLKHLVPLVFDQDIKTLINAAGYHSLEDLEHGYNKAGEMSARAYEEAIQHLYGEEETLPEPSWKETLQSYYSDFCEDMRSFIETYSLLNEPTLKKVLPIIQKEAHGYLKGLCLDKEDMDKFKRKFQDDFPTEKITSLLKTPGQDAPKKANVLAAAKNAKDALQKTSVGEDDIQIAAYLDKVIKHSLLEQPLLNPLQQKFILEAAYEEYPLCPGNSPQKIRDWISDPTHHRVNFEHPQDRTYHLAHTFGTWSEISQPLSVPAPKEKTEVATPKVAAKPSLLTKLAKDFNIPKAIIEDWDAKVLAEELLTQNQALQREIAQPPETEPLLQTLKDEEKTLKTSLTQKKQIFAHTLKILAPTLPKLLVSKLTNALNPKSDKQKQEINNLTM